MIVINARNVNAALPLGVRMLKEHGIERMTRNGPALVAPAPVCTVYHKPLERVLWWNQRDANPFFHFAEALWMLAGRNDLDFVASFVQNMRAFSDDGKTLHGAYGHRWRWHFGFDQLQPIIKALQENPEDRRQVLQMWDPRVDLSRDGKDLPCNTQVMFQRGVDGALNMTVTARSNDMIWGAYGANAVQFGYLMEYMAQSIGCRAGLLYQISNNFHAYIGKEWDKVQDMSGMPDYDLVDKDPYCGELQAFEPYPLIQLNRAMFDSDLAMFLDEPNAIGFREPFFRKVAKPIFAAHAHWKATKNLLECVEILDQCAAPDWTLACEYWLKRRQAGIDRAREVRAEQEDSE